MASDEAMDKNKQGPIAAGLNEELLQSLARQSRWVPVPVLFGASLVVAIGYSSVPHAWLAAWLAAVLTLLVLRFFVLGRLPRRTEVPALTRLRIAILLSACNGLVHGSAVAFFPYLIEYERFVVFMTILAFCAGSVSSTAGYRPVFLAYVTPTLVPLAVVWGTNAGGPISWHHVFVAILTVLYGLVLLRLAHEAFRLFRESFEIRLGHVDLNKRLEQALAESRSANAAKTRFLAVASHDLRQPVHALALFTGSLSRRELDDRTREIAQHIESAVDTLSLQLDALLDISKLDAGIVKPSVTAFDLSAFLERLGEQFAPLAELKRLDLRIDCPPNTGVVTDEILLEQIVRNLLGNAVKYTDRGAVSIGARDDGEKVSLTISDTGRGIPAHAQPHVFEEFYQVDNPERDRNRGLGLGLAITKRLVNLLDLPLAMQSEAGRGTTFTIELRRAARRTESARPMGAILKLGGLQVLVVDDEPEVREGMRMLLEDLGCSVVTAEGTQEALDSARRVTPDIVLSDLRLRGTDNGLATVRALRELVAELPAIVLTGDSGPDRLREAHDANVKLLHKPVRPDTLAAAIHETCGASSGERHAEQLQRERRPLDS